MQFVELLQGKRGVFDVVDARLGHYVDPNADGNYVGIPLSNNNGIVGSFSDESLPEAYILASDYTDIYQECAEVFFILIEVNDWDQADYEVGVCASMERSCC